FQQLGVGSGVHLAAQDFLGSRYRELSHVLAQQLARTRYFLLDFGLGGSLLTAAFFLGGDFRLLDQLRGALLGLAKDLRGAVARLLDRLVGLARRQLERAVSLLGGGEAVGDGLLPCFDGAQHVRPNELRGEPDKGRENQRLGDERERDVHGIRRGPRFSGKRPPAERSGYGRSPIPDRAERRRRYPRGWSRRATREEETGSPQRTCCRTAGASETASSIRTRPG